MKEYTLKELEKETCRGFGGHNCIFHGCMFGCELVKAKKKAKGKEKDKR